MSGDIEEAHRLLPDRVISKPGVTGTAIGQKNGQPCIKVYVESNDRRVLDAIPSAFRAFSVGVEGPGRVHPLGCHAPTGRTSLPDSRPRAAP